MAALALTNIRKSFGETLVLDDITLDIADGAFVVFVGPSGCGKSTLLRVIAGLEEVSGGEVRIDGEMVNAVPPAKRGVAMVFQSYALYPHMTVYDNMAFGLRLANAGKAEIDARVRAAAAKLRIEAFLDRKPKALSGGQRQRVAIGRAIVREPKVFLFDEPLSNLDAGLRVSMRYEIARLHQDLKTTMVYVTHDQTEAMTLADRIVVLNGGRIEQIGAPMELYERPKNIFVAGFIGSPRMNFLQGEVVESDADGARVRLATGEVVRVAADASAAERGGAVTVGVRPEQFDPAAASNLVTVNIRFVEQLGNVTYAYGAPPETETELTIELPRDRAVGAGETLRLGLAPHACHLFRADGLAFPRPREFGPVRAHQSIDPPLRRAGAHRP